MIRCFAIVVVAGLSLSCWGQTTNESPKASSAVKTKSEKTTSSVESTAEKTRTDEATIQLEAKGESHPPSVWMQQKLKHSQNIFAGMVKGDLIQVEEAARHLQLLNRLENFVRGGSKEYRTQLRLYQYANSEVLKGSQEKNLDRVALGYNQMSLSCVACHKQLREAK